MSPLYGTSDVVKVPDDTAAGTSALPNARFLMSPLVQDTFGRTVASTNYSTAVANAVAPISPTSQNLTIYYGVNGQATTTAFSVDAAELVITGTGATQFADFYVPVNLSGGTAFSLATRVQVSALGPAGVNGPNFAFTVEDSAGGLTAFASCQVTFNNTGITQLYLYNFTGGSATGNYGTMTANTQVGAAWWNVLWTYANNAFSLTVWPVTATQPSPQITLVGNYGTGATQLHFGGNPRDCTNWMDYWTLTPTISVPNATPVTVGLSSTDWNTVTGLGLQNDGTVGVTAAAASGKYWTTGFADFANASIPAAVSLLVSNSDSHDVVTEAADRAGTANANLAQTGLPLGAHAFGVGDSLAMQVTQYSGSTQKLVNASLGMVKIGQYTAPTRPANFLLLFAVSYNGTAGDASTHPWTNAIPWTYFASPTQSVGCGAGPPQSQYMSAWYRAIVPGESATVATFTTGGTTHVGLFCYEVAGLDMSTLAWGSNMSVVPSSTSGYSDITATATTSRLGLVGATAYAKVDYDSGWCTGWGSPGNVVSTISGTALNTSIGTSAQADCSGAPPWVWSGYASGGGTLLLRALSNSQGGGSGAYNCGFMTMRSWFTANVVSKLSIVQQGQTGGGPPGASVTLPAPPSQ